MKPSATSLVAAMAGLVTPWLIVLLPVWLHAGTPRWDGPGDLYYLASLVVVGLIAQAYERPLGLSLLVGLLVGATSLLVARSAPMGALLGYLLIAGLATALGWSLGLAARRLLARGHVS